MITLASLKNIAAQKNIWSVILDVIERRYPEHQGLVNQAREGLELINLDTFTAESLESVPVIFFPFAGEDTEQVCMFYIQALAIVMGCSYMHSHRSIEPTRGLVITSPPPLDGDAPVVAVDVKSVLEVALAPDRDGSSSSSQGPGLEVIASLFISRDLFHTVFMEHGLRLSGVKAGARVLKLWLLRGNIIFYFS